MTLLEAVEEARTEYSKFYRIVLAIDSLSQQIEANRIAIEELRANLTVMRDDKILEEIEADA